LLILLLGAGAGLAKRASQPMKIMARSHIQILQKQANGRFVQVDEVRGATSQVEASLLQLASGGIIDTALTLQAKTKKGRAYTAKLARPATVRFNPATGQLDADVLLEVSLDGRSATVVSKSTTESRRSPKGTLRGRRARGLLGTGPMTVNLVASNRFKPAGQPEMLLIVKEEYTLTPRGGQAREATPRGAQALEPAPRGTVKPKQSPLRKR